jgi:hypothetical protein
MPVSLYAPQLVKVTSLTLRLDGEAFLYIPSAMHLKVLSIENSKQTDLAFEDMKCTVHGLNYVTLVLPEQPVCEGATELMRMLESMGCISKTAQTRR